MRNLVLILIAIAGFNCRAQVATDQQSLDFCQTQFFMPADQSACFNLTQSHSFDVKAMDFCKTQFFMPSDRQACLTIIVDKQYSDAVLAYCANQFAPADKSTCIQNARFASLVKPSPRVNSCSYVQGQIQDVLTAMQNNDFGVAESIVKQVLQNMKAGTSGYGTTITPKYP